MSNPLSASNVAGAANSPAAKAVKRADGGINNWLMDLVTGAGSSPSHIIITGILGVVPGLGQAMDARDLILGIIQISKSPAMVLGWVELVITLIGCVPGVGDGLKVGFKLLKQGHGFGRVMEAGSPMLRGNIEKFFRKIDWASLATQCKALFSKAIAAFIDGLDSWFVKAVADGKQVKMIVDQLKTIQRDAPKMIDSAFAELKALHSKMLSHEVPKNTAAVAGTSSKTAVREAQQALSAAAKKQEIAAARVQRKLQASKNRDLKGGTAAPNSTSNSTKKAGKPKKENWNDGVAAEHITDYHVKKTHPSFIKANNHGKLREEYDPGGLHGIDHLWAKNVRAHKRFVVGETKSSIFESYPLIRALPADLQEKFAALRADESANPTPSGQANIFQNEERDAHANTTVQVTTDNEAAVRDGMRKPGVSKVTGQPTGLYTQMSHLWILNALEQADVTARGKRLRGMISSSEAEGREFPYERWVIMVTGRQLYNHRKSKGRRHDIQTALHLPNNILLE